MILPAAADRWVIVVLGPPCTDVAGIAPLILGAGAASLDGRFFLVIALNVPSKEMSGDQSKISVGISLK